MNKRIPKRLISDRNRIYYNVWEQEKNKITMEDLAIIFHRDLRDFYSIIKKQKIKNLISK